MLPMFLIEAIVKATPTQKDDAALGVLQEFLLQNPSLRIGFIELIQLAWSKGFDFKNEVVSKKAVELFFSILRTSFDDSVARI